MKHSILFIFCLTSFFSFSQNEAAIGAIRFTNFQDDHRVVRLYNSDDEVVDEVFVPEQGQGVLHELNSKEYCAKIFIKPLKNDKRLDGLDTDQIYETEFSVFITPNTEMKISIEKITKLLSLKAID